MPYRKNPFVGGEIYHVFNRSIAREPIFKSKRDYRRMENLVDFYRYEDLPLRYSHFNRLTDELKEKFTNEYIKKASVGVEIYAYCFMPNHFHFLLKPRTSTSLSKFMRLFQNGYSKYFNTKYARTGSLFQFMFKGVHIETDEQFLHVSRYIHLNPVTSYLIDFKDLEKYEWSSFRSYTSKIPSPFVNTQFILNFFKSSSDYKQFVEKQVDYQRNLHKIKHLLLENPGVSI